MTPLLITGVAGFIGYHLARRYLSEGIPVVGVDNLNAYYDPKLKQDRLKQLASRGLTFRQLDVAEAGPVRSLFDEFRFEQVFHLAAQAGVRYSQVNPQAYTSSNIEGFLNLIESCCRVGVGHLIYASSSSVYGAHTSQPNRETSCTDRPVSLYAMTKKANELMAHTYSWIHGLPCTGLRLFTVYGPWGRPDMALYQFADAILEDRPLTLHNQGVMQRDFTFIDDVVEAMVRLLPKPPIRQPDFAPARVLNVGNQQPVELRHFLHCIEESLGRKAIVQLGPANAFELTSTCADVCELEQTIGFRPHTPIEQGVGRAMEWYLSYRGSRG